MLALQVRLGLKTEKGNFLSLAEQATQMGFYFIFNFRLISSWKRGGKRRKNRIRIPSWLMKNSGLKESGAGIGNATWAATMPSSSGQDRIKEDTQWHPVIGVQIHSPGAAGMLWSVKYLPHKPETIFKKKKSWAQCVTPIIPELGM